MATLLKVDEAQEWVTVSINRFSGLDLSISSEQIDSEDLLVAKNIVSRRGLLQTDFGVKKYQHIVYGDPRLIWKLELNSGAIETLLITDKLLYKKDSNNAWQPIDNGDATTTTDTAEVTDSTVIGVTATTGFTVGQLFALKLDNNNWHVSNIVSIDSGVSVTITDGIHSAAASGNACYEACLLTGAPANPV